MNPIELLQHKQIEQEQKNNSLTTFINPFSYLFFRKNLNLFDKFDYLFVDGIALIFLLRIVGIRSSRFSFDMTSLAPKVFSKAIEQNKTLYFIGSSETSMNSFIGVIKSNFKGLLVVGYRHGYFKDGKERKSVLNNIATLNPDILVVGMGTPLQEMFLIDLKNNGWNGTGYTCGGFIHQTVNKSNYYPTFFNKFNLRWIYRMYDEPKLITRYFFLYPKAVIYFLIDFIRVKQNN